MSEIGDCYDEPYDSDDLVPIPEEDEDEEPRAPEPETRRGWDEIG